MIHNAFKKYLPVFLFVLFLSLTSCFESATGLGTGILNGNDTNSSGADSSDLLGDSDSNDLSNPSNQFGSPDDASIPISYLNADEVLIYSPDGSGLIPVAMTTDAFSSEDNDFSFTDSDGDGYADNTFLSVSTAEESLASYDIPISSSPFFRKAYAQSAEAQLCPIRTDGTVECFFDPQNISPTELYFAISDANGTLSSEVYWDDVQPNLYYVRATQTDMAMAGNDVFTLIAGSSVKLSYADENWSVNGDYEASYEAFASTGSRIVYDTIQSFLVTMNTNNGFEVFKETLGVYTPVAHFEENDALSFTTVKSVNNSTYYGISENSDSTGYLYNLLYNEFAEFEHIQFVSALETDAFGNPTTHKETLAFDINDDGFALVAYTDENDVIRIRASDNNTLVGNLQPLRHSSGATDFDILDLQFYDNNKALILDNHNKKLWLVVVNTAQNLLVNNLTTAVTVGEDPIKMVMNANKSKAYVLDAALEKVYVIQLENSDGSKRFQPEIIATVNLAIDGKNFTVDPNTIAVNSSSLFIGSRTTKAILEILLDDISESEVEDEDFDEDGFTSAEGDCSDNRASIHPDAPEICGDNTDNNCDGITDEDCDADNDGYFADGDDCDDTDDMIHPEAPEICDDEIDNDCDGFIDNGDEDCEGDNNVFL